ncbi:DUF99 family protein [Candidatus Borrarchaeum sp.]|uniref:endonuclease dU n=1 Tax=Candidatus Borrarchaeum sp. TaxID=2846742 RepID=UPI00257989D8|nr:DUF99 family protein [Candidatus Borrarchaeum sp.]
MSLRLHKKGLRVLGFAESFVKETSSRSVFTGVVMRGDQFLIDGFGMTTLTVGGMDATEGVLRLFKQLNRTDINILMMNGCIISWYNVIDLEEVFTTLEIPLVCITYEESEGLEKYFKDNFEDWEKRIEIYKKNGPRDEIKLHTEHLIYTRVYGMEPKETQIILDRFTLQGAVPEPLRVARLLARALLKSEFSEFTVTTI